MICQECHDNTEIWGKITKPQNKDTKTKTETMTSSENEAKVWVLKLSAEFSTLS